MTRVFFADTGAWRPPESLMGSVLAFFHDLDETITVIPRESAGQHGTFDWRARVPISGPIEIAVDFTETPKSVAWLIAHELTHMLIRKTPKLSVALGPCQASGSPWSDEYHAKDAQELICDLVATQLVGERLDRAWWRARTPSSYGAAAKATHSASGPAHRYGGKNPRQLSGAEVVAISKAKGAHGLAEIAGREIGTTLGLAGVDEVARKIAALEGREAPDLPLLAAVAWVESRGDDLAVSAGGAAGLMQLTRWTYASPTAINPFDPQAAVARAREVLSQHYRRAKEAPMNAPHLDPTAAAVMAYKEGWVGANGAQHERALGYLEKIREAQRQLR